MSRIRTVFVTGASGYIGRRVARAFRRAGWRVLGLTREAGKAGSFLATEVTPVIGSLQSPETWRPSAAAADVIVHAAVDYAADTQSVDQAAVRALIEAGSDRRATLIYTSGVWVQRPGPEVTDETTPLAPAEVVSKRPATERFVLESSRIRGVVVRPAVVYGLQGGLTAGLFTEQPVVGDGANHWPLVHVDDLADAYVRIAERGEARGTYLIADESRSTLRELATAARRAAGLGGSPKWLPLPEARKSLGAFADALARDHQVSAARATRELGWRPMRAGFLAEVATYAAAARGV